MTPKETKLLQNAVFIPEDNVYLVSIDPDEPVCHTYRDGLVLAIKGGLYYAMRGGDYIKLLEQDRYVEWIVTDDCRADYIADKMLEMDERSGKWILSKDRPSGP